MDAVRQARMRWRSRRGLLELDLVLDRFWASAGAGMTEGEAAVLEALLRLPDNDLLDLVMGRSEVAEEKWQGVVERLRAA